MTDREYMALAIALAKKGEGFVNPNPMVGAVLVKDNEVIGRGYHQCFGGAHAERRALASASADPRGGTLYVTLEPCCHYGKTHPCTQAILESGIRRVVVGSGDPNALVCGKGIAELRAGGVAVDTGVLKAECDSLNKVFFHYIKHRTPYVALKYAMTLDGKIATRSGKSQWITGEKAREHVHRLRHRYSGIMAGIGTVLADDPLLTCRMPGGRNPVRILCDTHLRVPEDARLVATASGVPTIIATASRDSPKIRRLTGLGCKILEVPMDSGGISLPGLLEKLGGEGLDSILLEGGASLAGSALAAGVVQKVYAYISPRIFGGAGAKSPVGGTGVEAPSDAFGFTLGEVTRLGDDILLECEVAAGVYRNY